MNWTRRRDDAGNSLVETLVAIVILGLAFTGVLGALGAAISTSDIHRQEAEAKSVLLSAAESVKDQVRNPWVTCDGTSGGPPHYDGSVGVTLPSGWAKPTLTYKWADGAGGYDATCRDTAALGHLLKLQLVTISVRSPSGRAVETISVVKRDQ